MSIVKQAILVVWFSFMAVQAFSQASNIIRGRVVDKADNQPVIGANVIEYDKENRIINGTITDVNGDFLLEMKDRSNIIRISVIGYENQEINTVGTAPLMVELTLSTTELEEVVVKAASRSKHSLTNLDHRDKATSSVKVDLIEMQDAGFLDASDALQGKVSGLDIIAASGDPGSGSQLVIRGLSGMGNSTPLIVIDGIPQFRVSSGFDLSSADSEDISELVNIALQDIKSIEILKDAASTAVYGSRGADGVLLIETNSGKLGKVQFDYQYKNSSNFQPPAIPMLNGDEYIMLQQEEWHNAYPVSDLPSEISYNQDYVDFYNYSANTDWLGALTKNSNTHDHFLKISGGGDKTRYYTSFSFVDEEGTTINTSSRRFSTRVNLDYNLSRKLLFSIQFSFNNNKREGNLEIDKRNVRDMAYIKAPNMSIWEHDSEGGLTGEYFTPIRSYQGAGSSYFNPVAVSNLGKDDSHSNQLQNTFRLRYKLNNWITLRETISIQYTGKKGEAYLPYNAIGVDWLAWNVNKADEENSISSNIRTETQMAFDSPFNNRKHVLSGAITWETNQSQGEWMIVQSNRTPSTDIQDPAIDAQINWIGTGDWENRQLSGIGNLNYKYGDRYMIQGSLNLDAHSSFGQNYRWGLFKGLALGWRFSSEPFMSGVKWLDDSKLKASWGVVGRQPEDAYARFARYESEGNYIENPAIIPTQVQLNNLRWENMTSWDAGIELNMFDYRFYLEANVYLKTTSDLLFGGTRDWQKYKIPSSSGFAHFNYLNGGELENKGWELMLNGKIVQKEQFRWALNFNISQNINIFNELPDNFNKERSTSINNGEYPRRVVEGEPIGSFFGFRYLGVFPTDQDALARNANGDLLLDASGNPFPLTYREAYEFKGGDPIYEDINKDGVIDLNDVVYIGDSNPDYIGGFGTRFDYKNFDLSIAFHYRLGFDIINMVALQTEGMRDYNNQSKAVLSRWRVQGQDEEGILPRAYLWHPASNLGSDRYVEPGDFLRLSNIKFGYRLRKDWCNKIRVRSMTIAVSARKMWTLTRYSGQDPEIGQDVSDPFWIGVDRAKTPPPRMFTMSVAVGF